MMTNIAEGSDSYSSQQDVPTSAPDPEPDGAPASGEVLVRRNIWELEASQSWHPITLSYAFAVRELQSRPPDDATSWAYQAAIHGTAASPPARGWNQCQHGGWYFLPWHRLYLYFFERILRAVVLSRGGPEDWALPYWNYDGGGNSNTLPPPFRQETLPDGSSNPLFVRDRSPAINAGAGLPPQVTSAARAMAATTYAPPPLPGFGGGQSNGPRHFFNASGELEVTPHNDVHVMIRGLMMDPNTAALDPIFWLHHCNIDRLWMEWNANGHPNPTSSAWTTQSFELFDERGAPETRQASHANDPTGTLGYRYDTISPERLGVALEAMPEKERAHSEPEMIGATEEAVVLSGQTQSVDVQVDVRAAQKALETTAGDEGQRLYLSVEHVDADATPGQAYAVYVEPPEQPERRFYVGNVSLFGIEKLHEERGEEGPHHKRFVFDVTNIADQLGDPAMLERMRVTFEPIGYQPGEAEGLEAIAAAEEVVPIRVGRITLRRG